MIAQCVVNWNSLHRTELHIQTVQCAVDWNCLQWTEYEQIKVSAAALNLNMFDVEKKIQLLPPFRIIFSQRRAPNQIGTTCMVGLSFSHNVGLVITYFSTHNATPPI